MSVFLRAPLVELTPLPPGASWGGRRAWLLPRGPLQDDPRHDGEIAMLARAPGGEPWGTFALADLDWVARSATVVATLLPGSPPPVPAVQEALGLVVRYAWDELNLERIEGRAPADARLPALPALGFREEGRLTSALRSGGKPRDAALWALLREPGDRP